MDPVPTPRREAPSTPSARLAGLLALALLAPGCDREPVAPRPDIVLYLCDTLRPDHLGAYGYERETSPHLDSLAEDAIVFEQAFAPSSWTKSSTASLLSGLDPLRHNATGRDTRLPERVGLLSETLQELGYHTVGFVTNPFVSGLFGFDQGYDEFEFLGRARAETLMDRVGKALDERPKEKPLFLYVHSIDPHAPYDAPAPFPRAFTDSPVIGNPDGLKPGAPMSELRGVVDSYDAEILYHDRQFGRLIGRLQKEGLYEDALFWFTSDHGDEYLEHGRAGHGRALFVESIRIPMILKLPGNERAGTRVAARSSSLDLVPTTLSYLNEFPPAESEGIDLLLDLDQPVERPPLFLDLDLMVEELFVAKGVVHRNFKYLEESLPERREFLFDLEADPLERENLIDRLPEVANELRTMVRLRDQSRRAGLTLHFVGEGVQRVRATLRTDGTILGVDQYDLEEGDRAVLSEDQRSATVEFALVEYLSNIGQLPTSDIDTVTLRLEPSDAEVTIEGVEFLEGEGEFPLRLGLERRVVPMPHTLRANAEELLTEDLGLLFQRERGAAGSNVRGDATRTEQPPSGVYAIALEGVSADDVESLPDDVRAQLEELGYMGHD